MARNHATTVSSGRRILQEFRRDTGIDECSSISLFDHHNVIDEMDVHTAVEVGVALDHLTDHRSVLLSYGHMHRLEAFASGRDCFPMVAEMDGYIFTDHRRRRSNVVEVYQHEWMKDVCDDKGYEQCAIIGITGDKGQAASILGKPAILFDDKEENIDQVIRADNRNAGCVVRIGSTAHHGVRRCMPERSSVSREPAEWYDLSRRFHESVVRADALDIHRRTTTMRYNRSPFTTRR